MGMETALRGAVDADACVPHRGTRLHLFSSAGLVTVSKRLAFANLLDGKLAWSRLTSFWTKRTKEQVRIASLVAKGSFAVACRCKQSWFYHFRFLCP